MTSSCGDKLEGEWVGQCQSCHFGVLVAAREYRDCPGMISKAAHVICHRYPTTLETRPAHWCGEYQPLSQGSSNVIR